jgi:hypothetical protein
MNRLAMKIDIELVDRLRRLGLTEEMIVNYYGLTEVRFKKIIEEQSNEL